MTTIQNLDSTQVGDIIQIDPGTYSFTATKSFTLTVTQVSVPPVVPNKDSQVKINELLKVGNVKLPPGIFFISDSILYQSGRTIEGTLGSLGECLTTIKLDKVNPAWGGEDVISKKKAIVMNMAGCTNITLKNIIIDGSQSDYFPKLPLGASWNNMATLIGIDGITFENVVFKNGCNDGALIAQCKNVNIKKCKVDKPGHDGFYIWHGSNIKVDSCSFVNRTNSSVRFDTVTNGVFTNNFVSSSGGGYAALELENTVTNIECAYNKVAKNVPGGIVARVHTVEKNVNVHDNEFF